MSALDKASVREEIAKLKADFESLNREGKVTAETQALMKSLFLMVDLILSIFLERTTKKNAVNSSIPPSQSDKDDSALGQSGSNQKKRRNHGAPRNGTVNTQVLVAPVEQCQCCGESLINQGCIGHERRTKIDILFEKHVQHVDAQIKECPTCHTKNKGLFPSDLHGPRQYGNGLKAFAVNLLFAQMVSLSRTQELLQSMIGEVIAESTLLDFIRRLYEALESWEEQAIQQLLSMPSMHVDETSFRVDRKNHWIHVYASGEVTLKVLHRKRGKVAIEDNKIIPRYGGTIIHDCWASYLSYEHLEHGLCGSHLLRELAFIIDAHDYRWARNLKRLLQETCTEVANRESKCFTAKELANLHKRYRNILTRGTNELPELPQRPTGKRGRLAKSDAHNLWERLNQYESSVLLFAKDPHVPFTNNRAERDLRMAKVKQKVSGCFRTEQYAKAYCRISSYLQTMANQGHNPLTAIHMALDRNMGERGE
jgi:transposase